MLYDAEKGNEIMTLQIAYAQFAIACERKVCTSDAAWWEVISAS